MEITASNEYVFLSYDKKKDNKKGILTSDVSRQKPAVFRVESVGDKVQAIKKGEMVLVDPFLPRELTVEGKTFYILKEKEIFGKVTDDRT